MKSEGAQRGLLRRFLGEYVRPYVGLQAEIGLCLLVGVALELADPLLIRVIIDRALGDGDSGLLVLLVSILGGVLLFRVAFRLLSVWLYSYSGLRILFDLRQRAFEHAMKLSPYFYRGERAGDLLARLTSDIDVLQRAAAHTVVNAIHDVLTIVGIVGALLWLDPSLTVVLLVVYPVLAVVLVRINKRLRAEGMRARRAVGGLFSFLDERLDGIRLLQEFRREKAEAKGHVQVSRPWIGSNLKLSVLGASQVSLADVMSTGAFIVVFLLGGWRVLDGSLSLGTLVAFYAFATRVYRPISGLVDINIDVQVARAALSRVYTLLDQEPELRDAPDATAPAQVSGSLRLRDVGLTWPDGTRVLDGIDLDIAPGEIVALVGLSGGGKSTLAALMARYLDPQQGQVLMDGLPLTQWKLSALRESVSVVPQETQLFHDSLRGNLRLARPDATDAELVDALHAVSLGSLLDGLSEGLDTTVGEQGMRLSGGERQRVALARMLLKGAQVHILDEATSALDAQTEHRVLSSLFERLKGRTLILIAHRLSSVTTADRIVVLDQGRVAEQGTHEQLYAAGGVYRVLFDEQTGGVAAAPADHA